MWWRKEHFLRKRPYLEGRMRLIRAMRGWFEGQGFFEVETPALQISPGMETHLRAFQTILHAPDFGHAQNLYLHTSPEFAMKKLLAAGLGDIFQICHCYRNAEGSHLHSPEFTMIEWYRAKAGYREIMADCTALLRHCAASLGIDTYRYNGQSADPFVQWEVITVCEAAEKYAGIALETMLDDRSALRAALTARGIYTAEDDSWDDLFMRLFLEQVEPKLGICAPSIIYDYPASMAALSRLKPEDKRFAERFELYVCGIELANAFGELTDPTAQRIRYEEALAEKKRIYGECWPVDEDFLQALEDGLPEAGGIALGIDRLAMLATGAECIDDVLWTGKPGQS
jgi:lysyl-tRNA synthetase class 2